MIRHVCFYGPRCSGVIAGVQQGGAERQVLLFARYLASQGLRVTILDPYAERSESHPALGLQLVKPRQRSWHPPGVPSIAARAPALARALSELAPDACYMRGFWPEAAVFAHWSQRAKRPFVISAASDLALDFSRGHRLQTSGMPWRDRVLQGRVQAALSRTNLRHATMLLAQHRGQVEQLRGRNPHVVIVPNIFLPDYPAPASAAAPDAGVCAWVGSVSPKKGVADLIDLARRAPDLAFLVAGAVPHPSYEGLAAALKRVPNISYLGALPAAEVPGLLGRSAALVNTSLSEGFPNTFLEAWWAGRPVASLRVDPGGVVRRHGAGLCADGSIETLVAYLRGLRDDPDGARAAGRAGHRYLARHHLEGVAGARLLVALEDAAALAGLRGVDPDPSQGGFS